MRLLWKTKYLKDHIIPHLIALSNHTIMNLCCILPQKDKSTHTLVHIKLTDSLLGYV